MDNELTKLIKENNELLKKQVDSQLRVESFLKCYYATPSKVLAAACTTKLKNFVPKNESSEVPINKED